MSYKDIRAAHREVWDDVQKSIARQDAARVVAQRRPELHTASARRRARVPRDEMIAMEVIWSLARHDLLCTEETSAVIKAARKWLQVIGFDMNSYPEDFEPADFELRDALNEYAVAVHPVEEKVLPLETLSATVNSASKN